MQHMGDGRGMGMMCGPGGAGMAIGMVSMSLLTLSAIAALIALTVFLIRRSRFPRQPA